MTYEIYMPLSSDKMYYNTISLAHKICGNGLQLEIYNTSWLQSFEVLKLSCTWYRKLGFQVSFCVSEGSQFGRLKAEIKQ